MCGLGRGLDKLKIWTPFCFCRAKSIRQPMWTGLVLKTLGTIGSKAQRGRPQTEG
jgi:hypothetical protein